MNQVDQFDQVEQVNHHSNSSEYTEEDARIDIEFLRMMVIDESNMEAIMQKLKDTIDYRKQICDDLNINLLERFPYFFTHSELVSIDRACV